MITPARTTAMHFFLFTLAAGAIADDKGIEPAQHAELEIDGRKFSVVTGHKSTIDIDGKRRKVLVKISPFKEFNKAGVRFRYLGQRHFSYDRLSKTVDHWSLDGNNTIVMVQRYAVEVTRKEIMDQFRKQFESMKAGIRQSGVSLRHSKGTLQGDRLNITLGQVKLSQDIFVIPGKNITRTLIIQDTTSGSGKNTREFGETKNLIEKTLSI